MADPSKYLLRVSCGPSYTPSTHTLINVNSPRPVRVVTDAIEAEVWVRIKDHWRGVPKSAPQSSGYFELEEHRSRGDRYSIGLRFRLLDPDKAENSRRECDGKHMNGAGDETGNENGNHDPEDIKRAEGTPEQCEGWRVPDFKGKGKEICVSETPSPRTITPQHPTSQHHPSSSSSSSSQTPAVTSTSKEPRGIPAKSLLFGNSLPHPIRDRLPPGFGMALSLLTRWIDPGLEGDVYSDTPHLFGPVLSSFNTVYVGRGAVDLGAQGEELRAHGDEVRGVGVKGGQDVEREEGEDEAMRKMKRLDINHENGNHHNPDTEDGVGLAIQEGGDEEGLAWRRIIGCPDTASGRINWTLKDDGKEKWVWEFGRWYSIDFFNPYIDFGELAVRLPGIRIPVFRYWDGQGLRYVLLNRSTQNPYLVILFTLHLVEDINPGDGSLKPDAARALELEQAGLKVTGADEGEMIAQEEELELEPDDEGFAEEERIGGEIGKFEGEVD